MKLKDRRSKNKKPYYIVPVDGKKTSINSDGNSSAGYGIVVLKPTEYDEKIGSALTGRIHLCNSQRHYGSSTHTWPTSNACGHYLITGKEKAGSKMVGYLKGASYIADGSIFNITGSGPARSKTRIGSSNFIKLGTLNEDAEQLRHDYSRLTKDLNFVLGK